MRWIGSLFILFLFAGTAMAQTDSEPPQNAQQEKQAYIKFHLDKPAKSIESIKVKQTGESHEGVISEDGHFVTVIGLKIKQRLVIEATYEDGSSETFEKSPCDLFEEYVI